MTYRVMRFNLSLPLFASRILLLMTILWCRQKHAFRRPEATALDGHYVLVSSAYLHIYEEELTETFEWCFRNSSAQISLSNLYVILLAFVLLS